jgi:hypothetical protein
MLRKLAPLMKKKVDAMNLMQCVEAKYYIVEAAPMDHAKALLKKIILPAMMLLGPVACGQQPGGGGSGGNPQKAQQTVNQGLAEQKITCTITTEDGFINWKFKSSDGDTVQLKTPTDKDSVDRNNIEVVKDAKTERMMNFQDAVMDTFGFGWEHVKQKYDCELSQDRDIPGKSPAATKPNL